MKGLFIPGITAEMFRNGCLESIEELMTEGEIYDIDYQQPCEDCRNCKKWNKCPCGKEGHENGTSIGYSIGECNNYEPCDDCISRQAVLDGLASIAKVKARSDAQKSLMGRVMFFVEQLPSVTSQPKMGRWVKTPKAVMGEGYLWYCDKCEHQVYQDTSRPYPSEKYCPNCGRHMVEPQKSEDKE